MIGRLLTWWRQLLYGSRQSIKILFKDDHVRISVNGELLYSGKKVHAPKELQPVLKSHLARMKASMETLLKLQEELEKTIQPHDEEEGYW